MSIQTLYTAATGMQSLETKLDVIANNLANVNTTAFKRDRCNFEDLFYRHLRMPGAQDATSQFTPIGIQVGLGVDVQSTQTQFQQGGFAQTTGELDVAIEGKGFFQVLDTNGQFVYTRAGNFSVNDQGTVVMGSANIGRLLQPQLQIPPDTTSSPSAPTASSRSPRPETHCSNRSARFNWRSFKTRRACSSWARTCTPKRLPPAPCSYRIPASTAWA